MKKIGITTDCVCDLPEAFYRLHDIGIVYFYITTDTGRFRDGFEIASENVIEYLENGGHKAETNAPAPEEYMGFFENALKKYDEIVHISITSKVSNSCPNAAAAVEKMGENGKRVHVVDSYHLSTGMGHMVIKAVELRDAGKSAAEIAEELYSMRERVSTSFITMDADYLYRNGKTSRFVSRLCTSFNLHPVLMLKDGRMTLKTIKVGRYDKAMLRYVRGELRINRRIDKTRLFITYAGCSVKLVNEIRAETERLCRFDEVIVTKASATVSGNCGPGTLGVLFVYE
ncbi:MAG: DegV family protein [Oscillospiraceae bacterium]|nr:DegV family EDD domain-containing protein [Oscillospiraceae bacterium]MDY2846911.1 DegV family protein [Oscillospiraceae bacterium]